MLPYLFNLLMNTLIRELISVDSGCRTKIKFYGCFLYADDIIVLSPSVGSLQSMLNTSVITCERIRL
jgi:hypothetical protein